MKLYNNLFIWGTLTLGMFSLAACSSDDGPAAPDGGDNTDGVPVAIKTVVKLNTQAALIKDLTNGHEMNVNIEVSDGNGKVITTEQTHAVNNGGNWTLDKTANLSRGYSAEVVAVYPYSASCSDMTKYPVDVTKQDDVLYSGTGSFASATSPTATLNMKHAMALLSVNLKLQNYSGQGVISSITVEDPNLIATKAELNARSGQSKGTEFGAVTATFSGESAAVATPNGISGVLPGVWVVPFSSKDQSPVKITVVIDGKTYKANLPEVTAQMGWQYAFQGIVTNSGLVFVPDATEQYQLDMTDQEFGQLNGYGKFTVNFTGSKFEFPLLNGENIFGNVHAADGTTANYTPGSFLTLQNTGAQTITIESWNSTGFEIHSMEGIDAIDLSEY